MGIELVVKQYNTFKLWALINALLASLALGFGYFTHSFWSLCVGASGLIGSGLLFTITKEPLVSITRIKLPHQPGDKNK